MNDNIDYHKGSWFGWVMLTVIVALLAIYFTPDQVLMKLLNL